jgi:1,4-alpha-glucan branching enzyme
MSPLSSTPSAYVRHLEYPRFLEEDWLYEAISETYLPLARMLARMAMSIIPSN